MDDARDALSDLDQMLADALDVQPSADFTARVRQRIASEPMRVPIWHGWRIAVATAAAGVAIAAASVAMLSKRGQPAPQVLSARSLPVGPLRPADVRSSRSTLVVDRPLPVSGARAASVAAVAPTEPEVLVPREDIEMYRRVIAAAQRMPRAFVVDAPQDIVASRSISEITIDPIKIELIMPPPAGGEGDRQ